MRITDSTTKMSYERLPQVAGDEKNEEKEENSENAEGRSPIWKATANLLSDMEGTGLLGLPFALLKGGLVALGALLVVPFIGFYTGKILIECLYDTEKDGRKVRVRRNYKDIASAIWPKFGIYVVVCTQILAFCLLASLYLVLVADLVGTALADLPISKRMWMVIAAAVGLPTTFFKSLSNVAWLSLLSVVALMIAICIVVAYGIAHHENWVVSWETIPPFDIEGVPLALAIIMFSYAAHVSLPSLESSLADRSKYNSMLRAAFMFTCGVKLIFALITFLCFRSNIHEVITTSIPMSSIRIAVTVFLIVNVMFSYPFRILALVHTLEDSIIPESIRSMFPELLWFIMIRLILNFVTLLPAVIIPHFALLMAFLGSLTAALTAFIYPCVFHLFLKHRELSMCQIILNCCLILFGFTASAFGLLATAKRLFEAYTS